MKKKQSPDEKSREEWIWSKADVNGWAAFKRDRQGPLVCAHNGSAHPIFFWAENQEEAEQYWKGLRADTREATQIYPCSVREVLENFPFLKLFIPDVQLIMLFKEEVPSNLRGANIFELDDGTIWEKNLITFYAQ